MIVSDVREVVYEPREVCQSQKWLPTRVHRVRRGNTKENMQRCKFLACLEMANFDVQTSYGGLKISEFNQEFISEV